MPRPAPGGARLRAASVFTLFSLCLLAAPPAARGHVALDSPLGGETLTGGAPFTIEWRPTVEHGTQDWDLWYSVTSDAGPWLVIAEDLPLGDPTAGSVHRFDWSPPLEDIPNAWVRVRQDNSGQDYYSVSNTSFRIVAPTTPGDYSGDGIVDAADYVVWRNAMGTGDTAADGTGDGQVTRADYLFWRDAYRDALMQPTVGGAAAVPEPAAALLVGLLLALLAARRGSRGD